MPKCKGCGKIETSTFIHTGEDNLVYCGKCMKEKNITACWTCRFGSPHETGRDFANGFTCRKCLDKLGM